MLNGKAVDAEVVGRLKPDPDSPLPPRIKKAGSTRVDHSSIAKRWDLLEEALGLPASARSTLAPSSEGLPDYDKHIENCVGSITLPLGVIGPLRIRGFERQADLYVPLATHEAALVASYDRGATAITEAGGCSVLVLSEGITRAPVFCFDTLREAGVFAAWLAEQDELFDQVSSEQSRHARFQELRLHLEGNHVYAQFEFTTGNAAGQNMVTLITEAICQKLVDLSPVPIGRWYVESNLSGDKKACAQSFSQVRGKKVCAEVLLPRQVVEARLRSSAEAMAHYWQCSALGGVMSGCIGVQGHYANGLASLYLATGQDVACVAESAVGVTRFESREDGSLYASVTLPNVVAGTVGGGTGLPSAQACLHMLGLGNGQGSARALAEVCGAVALAGELSIIAAMSAGHFAQAHRRLARGR